MPRKRKTVARKTIVEHETRAGNRLIETVIRTPLRVFAGIDLHADQRRFKVSDRDSFLQDLFLGAGIDLRKRTDPETGEDEYPTFVVGVGLNDANRADLDYIPDLATAPATLLPDGETIELPAVTEGPHANLLVVGPDKDAILADVDAHFVTRGTRRQVLRKEKDPALRRGTIRTI